MFNEDEVQFRKVKSLDRDDGESCMAMVCYAAELYS